MIRLLYIGPISHQAHNNNNLPSLAAGRNPASPRRGCVRIQQTLVLLNGQSFSFVRQKLGKLGKLLLHPFISTFLKFPCGPIQISRISQHQTVALRSGFLTHLSLPAYLQNPWTRCIFKSPYGNGGDICRCRIVPKDRGALPIATFVA